MINIQNGTERAFPQKLLKEAANAVLNLTKTSDGELTIALMEEREIRDLNKVFLEHDAPTDVLSFPSDEVDPETGRRYLGDIAIFITQAAVQADAHGHTLESEMQLLVIHGVLHLLGFDHAEAWGRERMWAVQEEALERIGLSPEINHD